MFSTHAGEAVFPCSSSCFADHLRAWLATHPSSAQHDAGEFAGWLRGQMFEKDLMPDHRMTPHAWDARLTSSTEDSGSLISPSRYQSPTCDSDVAQAGTFSSCLEVPELLCMPPAGTISGFARPP